jgi:hypothetical protein
MRERMSRTWYESRKRGVSGRAAAHGGPAVAAHSERMAIIGSTRVVRRAGT